MDMNPVQNWTRRLGLDAGCNGGGRSTPTFDQCLGVVRPRHWSKTENL